MAVENKKGFALLEIVIVVAIISIAFASLLGAGAPVFNLSRLIRQTTIARAIAGEGLEAARAWRDSTVWDTDGMGTINTGSGNPYYFSINTASDPDEWEINSGSETANGFTREIIFDRVSRDSVTDNIHSSYNPSYDDPDTRKVTISVSWDAQTIQIVTYFTNWQE